VLQGSSSTAGASGAGAAPARTPASGWRDPRLVPLLAAPTMGLLTIGEALLDASYRPMLGRLVLVALVVAVSLLLAVRQPSAGAVGVVLSFVVAVLVGAPVVGGATLVAVLLALAWAGYADDRRSSLAALGVAVGVFVVGGLLVGGSVWDALFLPSIFLPAWWLGALLRGAQARERQLVALAAALDAERERSAQTAVVAERTRIAREVHDAVAHAVSVMTLQIGGLRRQLDDVLQTRPAERDVMLGLERLGRQSVDDLRALVGILRDRGDDAPQAPAPSLGRLDELLAHVRAAGLEVTSRLVGEPVELPTGLDVSAYRVLQEALTNVLRHAPGSRCVVTLTWGTDAVRVRVEDDGAGRRTLRGVGSADVDSVPDRVVGGHGLVGMRERVSAFGGSLRAAPSPDGGFVVDASFPLPRRWS
jgi:signal transduction histidine kinase